MPGRLKVSPVVYLEVLEQPHLFKGFTAKSNRTEGSQSKKFLLSDFFCPPSLWNRAIPLYWVIVMEENMPTAKTAAKKPAPKTAKKVTAAERWENIEKGFERIQKAHEELEKAHRETEKTLNKAIGGLSNTLGSLVEHIMTPGLPRKFKQFGFTFDRITTVKWADGKGSIYTEIDGLLENGSQAMVVEVKTTLRRDDIDDHLERMERVRAYAGGHGDKREFLGAMAAAITGKDAKEYALSKGFFVIEPLGEDVKITKPVSGPKVWQAGKT
jgi:hypothetical protein